MFFLGVVTNQKNESYIKNKLSKVLPSENIIFITDKNILNVKNIKFETIIIDAKINNKVELRKLLSTAKYVILNSDIDMNLEVINDLNLTVITYGFNNKSTFTVSSITENSIIICLQRIIFGKNGTEIEPQEYQFKIDKNIEKYAIIASEIFLILYSIV